VAEHHDERRVEYLYGIFETCDDFIAGEIARDAANETSSRAVSKQYSGAIREVAQTTECVCGARPVLHSSSLYGGNRLRCLRTSFCCIGRIVCSGFV
jgi:hypothetical protein